jgi:hypothetical protein
MTVIAGLVDGDEVVIGADSATNGDGGRRWDNKAKVFRLEVPGGTHAVFGFAGRCALNRVVRFGLTISAPPDRNDEDDCERWVHAIAVAMTELGMSCSPPLTESNSQYLDGGALMGWGGRLWELTENLAQLVPCGYAAIGSGGDYAMGALYATCATQDSAESRIASAVGAACRWNANCHGPLVLERA